MTLGIFLYYSPFYFLRQVSSLNPKCSASAVTGQWALQYVPLPRNAEGRVLAHSSFTWMLGTHIQVLLLT